MGPEFSHPPRFFAPAGLFRVYSRVIQGYSGIFRVRQDSLRSMRKGSAAHSRPALCGSRIDRSVSIRPTSLIFGPTLPSCELPGGFHSGPGNRWQGRFIDRIEPLSPLNTVLLWNLTRWIRSRGGSSYRLQKFRAQGAVPWMPKNSLRGEIQ